MKQVCPKPRVWHDIYLQLKKISRKNTSIPEPPEPIILGGWWCTGDFEKALQWNATLHWIDVHGGREFVENLNNSDFHCVVEFGRPIEEKWSLEQTLPAEKYAKEIASDLLQNLVNNWSEIAGELAKKCMPVCFTGKKSRCLKIQTFSLEAPPWGTWGIGNVKYRDVKFTNKNEFTKFRIRINSYLLPHRVDHIKFFHRNASASGEHYLPNEGDI